MQDLTFADTRVRRDAEGRYSLNDLHRAAGGEERHSPNRWARTECFQGLVDELTPELALAPAVVARGGASPGTYVVEPLVVAYAAWISPKFHLEVINTFLAARGAPPDPPVRLTMLEPEFSSACKLAERFGMEGNQVLLSASNAVKQLHGVDPKALIGVTHLVAAAQDRHFTPTQLGQRAGLTAQKFNIRLRDVGLQEKRNDQWCPTEMGRQFAIVLDTAKRHHDGTPVTQLKWLETVMEIVEGAKAA